MFPYLGRDYELVLVDDPPGEADGNGSALRLRRGRFELPRLAAAAGHEHFAAWYRRRAADVLTARVAHFASLVGVAPPLVAVKDMRSRWGSCSAKGRISLHWGLVLLPLEVADYVVVHELVHLTELNHGERFWLIVGEILPDYRERRKRLRSAGSRGVI
jgi:predicted metal-dependent hydrolase